MIQRGSLDDLASFAVVARLGSFTRAAAELGVSKSALSYTIKRLETHLGVRLLQRNSRSVAPSEAGQRVMQTLEPALSHIGEILDDLGRERGSVSGTVRITATRQGYEAVIRPLLAVFAARHPAASIEVLIDYEFRDIIASRMDAGIRLGDKLEQDMIALKVTPDLRMAVVASPDYLKTHPAPVTPEDLALHRCAAYRMRPGGATIAWEFEQDGREIAVKIEGPLTVNEPEVMLDFALDGLGLAYVLEARAAPFLIDGRLIRLMEDWTPPFPGFFLYYPSRRQIPSALAALISVLQEQRAI